MLKFLPDCELHHALGATETPPISPEIPINPPSGQPGQPGNPLPPPDPAGQEKGTACHAINSANAGPRHPQRPASSSTPTAPASPPPVAGQAVAGAVRGLAQNIGAALKRLSSRADLPPGRAEPAPGFCRHPLVARAWPLGLPAHL